ncbi:MAG: hypothetical protein ACAH22_09735 [Tardiphaga sp.]
MGWAAYTDSWDFGICTSIWMVGSDAALYPPTGDLPILLVDDEVIKVKVVSASTSTVVIERDGRRWRLALAPRRPSRFPGSEWMVTALLKEPAPHDITAP